MKFNQRFRHYIMSQTNALRDGMQENHFRYSVKTPQNTSQRTFKLAKEIRHRSLFYKTLSYTNAVTEKKQFKIGLGKIRVVPSKARSKANGVERCCKFTETTLI